MFKTWPSTAGGLSLITGWGAKIPHPSQPKNQNIKQQQYCNTFNKDFKRERETSGREGSITKLVLKLSLCHSVVCLTLQPQVL